MTILNNFPSNVFKPFLILMMASISLFSCKKNNDELTPPSFASIEGLYSGMYGFDNDVPDAPEKYFIKEAGVFQQISIHNGSVVGQGTWTLSGNVLKATYTSKFEPYSKESISATFNSSTGKLTGTWGWDNSYTDGGKIELTKQ